MLWLSAKTNTTGPDLHAMYFRVGDDPDGNIRKFIAKCKFCKLFVTMAFKHQCKVHVCYDLDTNSGRWTLCPRGPDGSLERQNLDAISPVSPFWQKTRVYISIDVDNPRP